MTPSTPPADDPSVTARLLEARDERAPEALRLRVRALGRSAPRRAPRRLVLGAGLAGGLAGAILAVALLLSGGPGSPTVAQAAALALRDAQSGPPALDVAHPRVRLALSVGEVYFPSWSDSLGWRATGARADSLGGRRAVTVYYRRGQAEIAYTIVGLPALAEPAAAPSTVAGVPVRALRVGSRTVVTWRRGGETCVISTRSATLRELRTLAAWRSAAPLS